MSTRAGDEHRLPRELRDFLSDSELDANWPEAAAADLASCEFFVEETMLGASKSQLVVEGGVRLLRVTYYPMSLDDLSAISSRRPELRNARLVLAKFWINFQELPPKRQYSEIRILIRLNPAPPVLWFCPDLPHDGGHPQLPHAVEIKPEMAALLEGGRASMATAFDHGADGFGWIYRASQAMPLVPQRQDMLVLLELPQDTRELDGQLQAEAQISRLMLGRAISRTTVPAKSPAPFQVSLYEGSARTSQTPVGFDVADKDRPGSVTYDLGLIIALREEFDCAREVLKFEEGFPDGGYYLYPFSIPGSAICGICMVLYDMGPVQSGVAAARLLYRYEVKLLALIGIAGALNDAFRLGDAVVASSVDEYLHRAMARPDATGEGFGFDSGSTVWRAGRDLVSFANNFRYSADPGGEFANWRMRGERRRVALRLPSESKQVGDQPDYFVSEIASGEVVSAAKGFADWLRRQHRNCGAIEMEAGGIAHAVYQHGRTGMIIVRGISDFADERKQELDATSTAGIERGAWRRYAALNAVDLLAAMVRSPAFPWDNGRAS